MRDATQTLAAGQFLKLLKSGSWEYVERVNVRDVAVLVAVTSREEMVLVEQYRIPVRRRMIELPAGLVGDEEEFRSESLMAAANRELEEETGYRAGRLALLARTPSSGGMTSEIISFLHATDLEKVGTGGGVGNEEIVVHAVPIAAAPRWLRQREREGLLLDPKIYVGLFLLQHASCA